MTTMQQAIIAALRALIVTDRWPDGRWLTRDERTQILNTLHKVEKVVGGAA